MEATLPLRSNFVASPSFVTRTAVPCRRTQTYQVSSALVSRPTSRVSAEKVLIVDPEDMFNVSSRDSLELIVNNVPGRTDYQDSWFDRLATNHLSQSVQAAVGIRNKKSGYESLVEAARAVYKNFNPIQQRDLVILALAKAFPSPILNVIRTMMPNSRLAREFFAAFTTVFFAWLVGPCEVKESEVNGKTERNVVHIKKCRFLEESNCVGMCLNLCKVPSQTFIKESLGMPVDMVPNFEDMSCEMVFGKEPLMSKDDPAFKQPCYKLCKAKQKHTTNCIN